MPSSRTYPHQTRRRLFGVPLLALLLALLAACSSGSGSGTTTSPVGSQAAAGSGSPAGSAAASSASPAFPVTLAGSNGPVTLTQAPKRIVSMSPSATEMLFAIGAGPQVAAVDSNSNYPAQAPTTKLSAFQPNAEAVIGYKPDLVVISNDANGFLDSMTKLKVPTLVLSAPATLDDAYAQMVTLGKATGRAAEAGKLVEQTTSRVAAAVASAPPTVKGKKIYHELDQNLYSVTSSTFIGSIYAQFGLVNIADKAKGAAAAGGYPQLSGEYVVQQAPDVVVLADTKCCQQSEQTLAKRPSFGALPAVKNGAVLAADDDIASRWGPRIADFAESVAKTLQNVK